MAIEKARRSRWDSGVRAAARQISRIFSGLDSDFSRVRAARVLSLLVKGVLSPEERIDEVAK